MTPFFQKLIRWSASVALAGGALFLDGCASRPDLVWTENGRQYGKASWYDDHGDRTANGERFNMHAHTAAHPSLALNSLVEVTNLRNGKTITVRINDRLPSYHERVIDLSVAAFRKLDDLDRGLLDVELRVIRYGNNRYAKTEAAAPSGQLYLAGSSARKAPAKAGTATKAPAKAAADPAAKAKATGKPVPSVKASAKGSKPAAKPAPSPPKNASKASAKPASVTPESPSNVAQAP